MPEHRAGEARPPLCFDPPGDWPVPNDDWVLEHQGWTPPDGWRAPGATSAAPAEHTWWVPNEPAWSDWAEPQLSPYRRRRRTGLSAAAIGTAAAVVLHFAQDPAAAFAPIAWGVVVFGLGTAAVAEFGLRRARRGLIPRLGKLADRLREVSEQREHDRLRRDAGDAAMPFEEFRIDRERRQWASTAGAQHRPGDLFRPVHDDGELDEWGFVEPQPSSLPSFLAVATVALLLIGGYYALGIGDGTRELAFEERPDAAPACESEQCWAWQVDVEADCAGAVAVIGLSISGSRAFEESVEVPLGPVSSSGPTEVRLEFADGMPLFAGIQAITCPIG